MKTNEYPECGMYIEVDGFPGYWVGSDGSLWSQRRPDGRPGLVDDWRRVRGCVTAHGYVQISLQRDGRACRVQLHRLVLEAFHGPCPGGMQACHNNGVKTDNRAENLRWDTPSANQYDRERHWGAANPGVRRRRAKLTRRDVRAIRWMLSEGATLENAARLFGVHVTTVHAVSSGRNWKHVGNRAAGVSCS